LTRLLIDIRVVPVRFFEVRFLTTDAVVRRFPIRQGILVVRSPVFRAMIQRNEMPLGGQVSVGMGLRRSTTDRQYQTTFARRLRESVGRGRLLSSGRFLAAFGIQALPRRLDRGQMRPAG
jgi:hypothetical protein